MALRTLALFLMASAACPQTADLVLRNGKVVTMEASVPLAQAVAVRGDRILAVGSEEQVRRVTGPATQVIDLGGKLAIPGFIEGHGHFTGVAPST
jgi:predicted amidohydrolase YtcJ